MEDNEKQEIRELEAAAEVVRITIEAADKEWPEIYKSLQDLLKEKLIVENEKMAPFDFALAVISLGLESTKNIFTAGQSQRLSNYVYDLVDTDEYGDYAKKELEQYQKIFNGFKKTGNLPHDEVAARLLYRLLGKNIHNIAFKFGVNKTEVLNPLIVSTFSSILIQFLAPNPWKIIHDQYKLVENDFSMEEVKKEVQKQKETLSDMHKITSSLEPQSITDLINDIDIYLKEMREKEDKLQIPKRLNNYIRNYFLDFNPNKDEMNSLALTLADKIYKFASNTTLTDNYTQIYFSVVIAELWDALQARGIDTFYILDNELREDRFMLTIQLFALTGIAVVTPYRVKNNYHKYMTIEEQAEWVMSFVQEDFDPKKVTFTMDSSEDLRYFEIMDLIKKYMKHRRNIIYIEKDATVNYLEEVKKIAKNSKYLCIFRNESPENPNVTIIK